MKEKDYLRIDPDADDRAPLPNTMIVPGNNQSEIAPLAPNPPVPNRAWTAMKAGYDIEELSEDEKLEMYLGRDELF